MSLRKIIIDHKYNVNANIFAIDSTSHKLVFMSVLGYDAAIRKFAHEISRKVGVYVQGYGNYQTKYKDYDIIRHRDPDTDYAHAVASVKDNVEMSETGIIDLTSYIYSEMTDTDFNLRAAFNGEADVPDEIATAIITKLRAHMPLPIIDEWKEYIVRKIVENQHLSEIRVYKKVGVNFRVFRLTANSVRLMSYIQNGLREASISINGTNAISNDFSQVVGMDTYLNTFSMQTTNRLDELFEPKFIPNETEFSEKLDLLADYTSYKGISLYHAQKVVIQSSSNNLDKNDVTFVIATPGSGKTIIAGGIVSVNTDKENTTSIVLAPGHLVEKWAQEIRNYLPLSEAIVVEDFNHFKSIESKINNKRRRKHLFLIMSNSTAKMSYDKRPAPIWSSSKKAFCCPSCGNKLFKKEFIGTGRNRMEIETKLGKLDFVKPYAFNKVCMNDKPKWDKESRSWIHVPCEENLWVPFMKEGADDGKWIRLPKSQGWTMKEHMQSLFNDLVSRTGLTRNEVKLMNALQETIESEEDGTTIIRAPRKYSLSRYIMTYYKGKIDYLIADEMHKFKGGNSLQGQAFGDLVNASRKVIGLTGTLLNGYADSLFYILYRAYPQLMLKEGFAYTDERPFAREFGVVRNTSRFNTNRAGNISSKIGKTDEKFLPGVSPLVFTKFLLENAVFLNLEDISDELPDYQEIPISVRMDSDLQTAYENLEGEFRSHMGFSEGGSKIMGAMLQALSAYPDMPYDQPNVIHPETGKTLVRLDDLPIIERTKEIEAVRLCRERIAAGDKVLLYYHWTNRTNVAERMTELLEAEGLRVTVLSSNSSTSREREAWIKERTPETDVLICNPSLVETGLDLLDYTSIIFYQVGYDIFTMRQASKRSYRLNQTRDVKVYFIYYQDTIQEQALSLMATKLQASQAIEGNFSEEGLHAMSNNEDLLTQIANSIANNMKLTVDVDVFTNAKERMIHSPEIETEEEPLAAIFDNTPADPKQEVKQPIFRIQPGGYSLSESAQKKRKKKRGFTISPVQTATIEAHNKLRSKELLFSNFM